MADEKITQLVELLYNEVSTTDVIVIVDVSSGTTKKLKIKELILANAGTGGIGESPTDGKAYVRLDAAWENLRIRYADDADINNETDGQILKRVNGKWTNVDDETGGTGTGTDEKVKATSGGVADYLNEVLYFGDFVENTGDSDVLVITGKDAASEHIKSFLSTARIVRPNHLPQIIPYGGTLPSRGSSSSKNGVKVYRIDGTDKTIWNIAFDAASLTQITSGDMNTEIVVNNNGLSRRLTLSGLAALINASNNIYTLVATPTSLPAHGSLQTELQVFNNSGIEVNIDHTQFQTVAIGGFCTNATFSTTAGHTIAQLLMDSGMTGTFGQQCGAAVIHWADGQGHTADVVIPVIWDENGSIGVGDEYEIKSLVRTSWPAYEDLDGTSDYLVFVPGQGVRIYHYDSSNTQYCYESMSMNAGQCIAPKE